MKTKLMIFSLFTCLAFISCIGPDPQFEHKDIVFQESIVTTQTSATIRLYFDDDFAAQTREINAYDVIILTRIHIENSSDYYEYGYREMYLNDSRKYASYYAVEYGGLEPKTKYIVEYLMFPNYLQNALVKSSSSFVTK